MLINELPIIPPIYMPTKQIVDVTKFNPKVIGEQPPKPPPDKNQKKPQKDKAPPKKKGALGQEEREIRWAGMPQPPPKTSYDHFNTYNDQQEFHDPS